MIGMSAEPFCSRQPKKVYVLKVLTRPKSEWKPWKNPNGWKHLQAILLHCFNPQINSREFSKAV